ncbi:hypothetical protein HDU76_013317, partial [Blyttiomyces sp. JEL0837]
MQGGVPLSLKAIDPSSSSSTSSSTTAGKSSMSSSSSPSTPTTVKSVSIISKKDELEHHHFSNDDDEDDDEDADDCGDDLSHVSDITYESMRRPHAIGHHHHHHHGGYDSHMMMRRQSVSIPLVSDSSSFGGAGYHNNTGHFLDTTRRGSLGSVFPRAPIGMAFLNDLEDSTKDMTATSVAAIAKDGSPSRSFRMFGPSASDIGPAPGSGNRSKAAAAAAAAANANANVIANLDLVRESPELTELQYHAKESVTPSRESVGVSISGNANTGFEKEVGSGRRLSRTPTPQNLGNDVGGSGGGESQDSAVSTGGGNVRSMSGVSTGSYANESYGEADTASVSGGGQDNGLDPRVLRLEVEATLHRTLEVECMLTIKELQSYEAQAATADIECTRAVQALHEAAMIKRERRRLLDVAIQER